MWIVPCIFLFVAFIACVIVNSLLGIVWATIAVALAVILLVVLLYFSYCSLFSGSAIERKILTCGLVICGAMLTHTIGPHVGFSIGENKPWNLEFKCDSADPHWIWATVVIFVSTIGFTAFLNYKKTRPEFTPSSSSPSRPQQ
jgi:hypothetical protein